MKIETKAERREPLALSPTPPSQPPFPLPSIASLPKTTVQPDSSAESPSAVDCIIVSDLMTIEPEKVGLAKAAQIHPRFMVDAARTMVDDELVYEAYDNAKLKCGGLEASFFSSCNELMFFYLTYRTQTDAGNPKRYDLIYSLIMMRKSRVKDMGSTDGFEDGYIIAPDHFAIHIQHGQGIIILSKSWDAESAREASGPLALQLRQLGC